MLPRSGMPTGVHSGPWCGGVTDTSAIVKVTVAPDITTATLQLSPQADPSDVTHLQPHETWTDPDHVYGFRVLTFCLNALQPETAYVYSINTGDPAHTGETAAGAVRTLPARGSKADLRLCCGSCSSNRKWLGMFQRPAVFDAIRLERPQLFLHLGDFYYDIKSAIIGRRLSRYDWTLQRPAVAALLREVPIAYVWDDHDFLGQAVEGGDATMRPRALAALEAYDRFVPHYQLPPAATGIYQSFAAGRVLFIVADTRFARSPRRQPDTSQKTMLGEPQRKWLESHLLNGRDNYDLIVWANSVPWLGGEAARDEAWSGYTNERRTIADFIKKNNVRNLCMIAGDAHMLAIDDGRHCSFSSDGRGGFPVFHASALESRPSKKGGLYTIGRADGRPGKGIPGFGQYGVVEIVYEKDERGQAVGAPRVRFIGRRTESDGTTRTLIAYEFSADATYADF